MIEQYIAKSIDCACGKVHKSRVEEIIIEHDVIHNGMINYLKKEGYSRLTVVCDKNGYRIAGREVCEMLDAEGISYKLHMFQKDVVAPDEHSIGNLAMGMDLGCDLILTVGSGTVNDICRYVSAVAGKPFCTLGIAPSMDGYISSGSALIYNNLKLTFETHTPKAVFFDPKILAEAPRDMIAAGVGDLLGKINCLTDWNLSHIINDEWRCDFIVNIVDAAIQKTVAARDGIDTGDNDAVAMLLEALLLSGVCMDYAGNSRPASGCEHHLSHFWEMRYLLEGREAILHGTKVGIGTIIALKGYAYIASLDPDFDRIAKMDRMPFDEWETKVRRAFLSASDEVVDLEKKSGKNSVEKLLPRLEIIRAKWPEIKALAANTTKPELVKGILTQLDAPTMPHEIGVEREMAREAILYAKEIRNRYTVLQLLWDLGELENFTDMIINEYYG